MSDIRIKDLPLATGGTAPVGTDAIAIDGLTTRKTTISALGDVAVPVASQAEAESGGNAYKRMTPLTTKQSIASEVGVTLASAANGVLASTALQPGDAATPAQGVLADTALQPSAIGVSVASAAQGIKADTALQPAAIGVTVATAAQGAKADNSVQQNGTFTNIGVPTTVATSYIDAYTSGGNRDYDTRIEFSGGSSLRDGQGLANILGRLYQRYDPYYSTALGTPFNINEVIIGGTTHNDDVDVGSAFVSGQVFSHYFGGTNAKGGRQAHAVYAYLSQPTNAANPNRNYVGVTGVATAQTNDTGANTTLAGSAGALFGGGFVGAADTGATNLANVTGAEFNTAMHTGSSAYAKSLAQFSGRTDDLVAGAVVNSMLWLYNQASAVKWDVGLHFMGGDGVHEWPIKSGGFIVKAEGGPSGQFTIRDDTAIAGNGYGLGGDANGRVAIGRSGISGVPYFDFFSSASSASLPNVRLQASGGTSVFGSGVLTSYADTFIFSNKIRLSSLPPVYANDAAAAAGGLVVGDLYANSSFGNCLTVRRV